MRHEKLYRVLAAGVLGLGLATPAGAAGYCSAGAATEGIAAGNLTFEGAAADDCYGVVAGNISKNSGEASLNAMNWGTGWTYLDATDTSGATFMGLRFKVSATPGSTGSWTLKTVDTNGSNALNLPAALDFAVGLKAADKYALWGFDNVVVNGSGGGTFSILFTNPGGQRADLSHLIVFGREAGGGPVAAVPEPKTYAMLLAGLGLVGFATIRKLR